jgi:hypothetical protein
MPDCPIGIIPCARWCGGSLSGATFTVCNTRGRGGREPALW